jgi:F-type H+-transporting ATPase subunit alpha
MPIAEQIAIIYAGTRGHVDDVPVARVREFEREMLKYMREQRRAVLDQIAEKKELTEEIEKGLVEAIGAFKKHWKA